MVYLPSKRKMLFYFTVALSRHIAYDLTSTQQAIETYKHYKNASYSAFTSGYKHKFTYLMRTIENIENFMLLLDKVIKQKLIPALFNDFQISEELRSLIALPCKLGGMDIINPTEIANEEYVTKTLTSLIIQQEHSYTVSEEEIKKNVRNTEETNGKTTKNFQFIA